MTGVHRYPDFEALAMDHTPTELGFPLLSREEIAEKMECIYSKEQIVLYGALALSISLC